MTSANREIVVNPLERAVSTDIMRGQNFSACVLAEILRAMTDTNFQNDDVLAGGGYAQTLFQGNPLDGQILGGFVFSPTNAGTGATVGPGVACVYDPDSTQSSDDSQFKMVDDPGTSLLALTPNAGPGIRIDVVEMARVQPDNVIETESRDVFNTVTGIFGAATVTKVTQGQFQYRIRVGTQGFGWPGTAQGWLPIAVLSVPSGTTTWDTVTIWDVRPLVTDSVFGLANLQQNMPRRTKLLHSTFIDSGSSIFQLNGIIEATLGRYRLGGQLRRGSPGTDYNQAYVDFTDTANQESGMSLALVGSHLVFMYLIKPFGLPRWARYTDAAGGPRTARSPRGIPLLSFIKPSHVLGTAQGPITFPSIFGFGSTQAQSYEAVCVGALTYGRGSLNGEVTSGKWTSCITPPTSQAPSSYTPNATNPTAINFTLTENTDYPAGATRLRLLFAMTVIPNVLSGGQVGYQIFPVLHLGTDTTHQPAFYFLDAQNVQGTSSDIQYLSWTIEVEVPNTYPAAPTNPAYTATFILANGNAFPTGWAGPIVPSLQVVGWQME